MTISIFGLGYVGCVSAACLTRLGHRIIGVDIVADKVKAVNAGCSPVLEPSLRSMIKKAHNQGVLKATQSTKEAIRQSSIAMICVGTPSRSNGHTDLSCIFSVIKGIAKAIRDKKGFISIVIRSTVPPGTTQKCIREIIRLSGKKVGKDFGIAVNPEFLREGHAVKDFFQPPYTLLGSDENKTLRALRIIYKDIRSPIYTVNVRTAETIKYLNNVWHALKVCYANEVSSLCQTLNVNSLDVMRYFLLDKKLNLSDKYLYPGHAFGGSCLPKDVRAFARIAVENGLDVPILNSIMASNRAHMDRIYRIITQGNVKKIGILGLSFKQGTDDLRESPMVEIVERLIGKGHAVCIYDEKLCVDALIGSNRRYMEEHLPHLHRLLNDSLQKVVSSSSVLVVAHKTKKIQSALMQYKKRCRIVDLVRLENIKNTKHEIIGIGW